MKKQKIIVYFILNITVLLLFCGCPTANPGPDLDVSSLEYYGIDLSEGVDENGNTIPQDMDTQLRMVERADVYELIRLYEKVDGEAEAALFSRLLEELERDPVNVVENIGKSRLSEESVYNLTARLNTELVASQPDETVLQKLRAAMDTFPSQKEKGILRKILGSYSV